MYPSGTEDGAGNGGAATSVGRDQLSLRQWADRAAAKVVEDHDPQAVYLFGSVARGDDTTAAILTFWLSSTTSQAFPLLVMCMLLHPLRLTAM